MILTYQFHMPDNKITKPKTVDEVKDLILRSGTGFDAKWILGNVEEELNALKNKKEVAPDTYLYKSMTLFEFDKGILLASSLPERFRVFALEFSRNLQKEYECKTQSEKSMAEIVALNFSRVLAVQEKVNSYLTMGSITDMGVKYLAVVSKELDRALRHYLASLQTLKMLKMPPLEVSIRTQTAIVGQNQVVQANNK